eukprot:1937166-Lingulodinium_polyedra.AAC.1
MPGAQAITDCKAVVDNYKAGEAIAAGRKGLFAGTWRCIWQRARHWPGDRPLFRKVPARMTKEDVAKGVI